MIVVVMIVLNFVMVNFFLFKSVECLWLLWKFGFCMCMGNVIDVLDIFFRMCVRIVREMTRVGNFSRNGVKLCLCWLIFLKVLRILVGDVGGIELRYFLMSGMSVFELIVLTKIMVNLDGFKK